MIGAESGQLRDAREPHEDVPGAVAVDLHGRDGLPDSERRQEFRTVLVRLPGGDGLSHPYGRDAVVVGEFERDDAHGGLEPEPVLLERVSQRHRGAQQRMAA